MLQTLTRDELIPIIGIAIGIVVVFAYRRIRKQRAVALKDYGMSLGLEFDPEPLADLSRFKQFKAFDLLLGIKKLPRTRAMNTLTGTRMIAGRACDIQAGYHNHAFADRVSGGCPYVMLRLAASNMPKLIICEEWAHQDKLLKDIDFTGSATAEKFSKRFFIQCDEETSARELIQPGLMDVLLERKRMNWLEFDGDTVCLYHQPQLDWSHAELFQNDLTIKPLVELVELMERLVAALPRSFTR